MSAERLNELTEKIVQWGRDRCIIQNSNPFAQTRKTVEEVFELVEALAEGKTWSDDDGSLIDTICLPDAIDAIGDIYVTLVMVAECNGTPLRMNWDRSTYHEADKSALEDLKRLVPDLVRDAAEEFTSLVGTCRRMVQLLVLLCEEYEWYCKSFADCVQKAYDEIKDRTGTLRADGVFVKD